jgi:hypothetical protein
VQDSSSDECGSFAPSSLGNELVEFAYAASDPAVAAVELISLWLQFEGVVCPGATGDPSFSAKI